jgi:hypothetical protein
MQPPPGTKSTSDDSTAAKVENVRRSAVIDCPPNEAARMSRSGVRERNWCGPAKSGRVTPSYSGSSDIACPPAGQATAETV